MCTKEQLDRMKFPWFIDEMNCAEIKVLPGGKSYVIALQRPAISESVVVSDCESTTVVRCVMAKGVSLERHWHRQTEVVVVQKGALVMEIAGDGITLRDGDSVVIEAGVPHSSLVHSDAEFMVIFHPKLQLCVEGLCDKCKQAKARMRGLGGGEVR